MRGAAGVSMSRSVKVTHWCDVGEEQFRGRKGKKKNYPKFCTLVLIGLKVRGRGRRTRRRSRRRRGWRLWQEERGEVIYIRPCYIGAKTVSLSPFCSLMRSPGSLLVSSHVSITDADTSSTRPLCPAHSQTLSYHWRLPGWQHCLGPLSSK